MYESHMIKQVTFQHIHVLKLFYVHSVRNSLEIAAVKPSHKYQAVHDQI